MVAGHSGKVSSTVSKNTDYVVVGADPGSKADKAKSLGVTTLSEDDFEALLAGRIPVAAAQSELGGAVETGPKLAKRRGRKIAEAKDVGEATPIKAASQKKAKRAR